MKNVLVTGGCGFIGSHTCIHLINNGFKIYVVDSNINSSSKVLEKVKTILSKNRKDIDQNLIFEKGDIRDDKFLNKVFLKNSSSNESEL